MHVEEPSPRPKVFVRNATGLVREASGLDAAFYNLIWSSIPLAAVFLFTLGISAYQGANLLLTVTLNALVCLPTAYLYAVLSTAMPRSGADYVWVSRSVHPLLGFMSNWNFVVWMLYFIGVYAVYFGSYGLSTFMRVLAAFSGNAALVNAAAFFATPLGVFLIGAFLVLASGALFILTPGLRTFMRIQKWAFLLYMLGGVVLPVVAVITAGHGFPSAFNHYMASLNVSNAYERVLRIGAFSPSPMRLGETILAMTLPFYVLGNIFQSAYFAGEIKRGRGVHIYSMPITLIFAAFLMLILIAAFQIEIGPRFLGSLAVAPPAKLGLGFTPIYAELAAAASGNVVIGLVIAAGFAVGLMFWVPQTIIIVTRSLFAWSFDGLISARVSDVDERTHSPTLATAIIVLLSLVSVALVAFVPGLTALVGLLGLTITLLSVSVAGILFPYRQPDAWQASGFSGRMLGWPTVSWLGLASLVGMSIMAAVLLSDPNSGTSWAASRSMVYIVAFIYVSAIPFYLISQALRRRRGIDPALAYREIPPE